MLAPPAVKVAVDPAQIAVELAVAVIIGNGFTVKLIVCCVPIHPAALVPVTEYTVVEVGLTAI